MIAALRPLLLVCALWLSGGSALAQEVPKQAFRYGYEDGLSQVGVLGVVQTRDGRLWVATGEGVTIFSGGSFQHLFRGEDEEIEKGLRSDYIYALFHDRDDQVWVGTSGGGASLYSGRDAEAGARFLAHAPGDGKRDLASLDVLSFAQDAQGRVWIGSAAGLFVVAAKGGGLVLDAAATEALAAFEGDKIYAIHPLEDGSALIGTEKRGFWLFTPGGEARALSSAGPEAPEGLGDEARKIFQDREGRIWAGFNSVDDKLPGGLLLYDPQAQALTPAPFTTPFEARGVMSIAQGGDGRLWFGTRKLGIYVLDPRSGAVEHYGAEEHEAYRLSNPHVSALTPDATGRMWAGAWNGGLNSFSMAPDVFETYVAASAGAGRKLSSLIWALEEHEGGLWVGSAGGLTRLDLRTRRLTTVEPSRETRKKAIWSLLSDGDRLLLGVGDASGLFAYEPKTGLISPVRGEDGEILLKGQTIRVFLRDSAGDVWAGTNADGLYKLEAGTLRILAHYDAPAGGGDGIPILPGRQIRALSERPDGSLWIGADAGLVRLDPRTGAFETFAGRGRLPDDNVRAVYEASDGRVFVATGGGLGILTAQMERIRFIRNSDAFRSKMLYSLLPDDLGKLWISSNNGLIRYDVATGAEEAYRVSDGLQGQEFNFNAFERLSDGRIAVGGVKGISIFDPRRLEINLAPPVLSLLIKDRELAEPAAGGGVLALGAAPQSLAYRIGVRHYDEPRANRLFVKLEPFDKEFKPFAGSTHDLHHDNLPAGTYRLSYYGVSPAGVETERVTLSFSVQPGFYASWPMLLAYLLAGLGTLAALVFLRTRQIRLRNAELEATVAEKTEALQASNQALQEQAAERARFYARASHEIRTPLALIRAPARSLLEEDLPEEKRRDLARLVQRASDRLLQVSDEMMAVAKDGARMAPGRATVDLRGFLEPICRLYAESARLKGLEFSYEIQGPQAATFDLAAAETALHNLLSNAVKHGTPPLRLKLLAALRDERLEIRLSDDGPGLPEEVLRRLRAFRETPLDPPPSHGLEILAAAILKAGGDLQVDAEKREIAALLPAHAQGAPRAPEEEEASRADLLSGAAEGSAFDASGEEPAGRILIVEDDRDLREYLVSLISPLAPVCAVASVAAARRALERSTIDLALCDVMLPDGSGFDFAQHLKTHEDSSHTPLIFLTALQDLTSYRRALEVWADDYLTKPFEAGELLAKIEIRLRAQAATRAWLLKELQARDPEAAEPEPPAQGPRLSPLDRRIAKAFQAFLEENLGNAEADLAMAAAACGMSPRNLQRKLAALYGESFSALTIRARMERAQKLLAEGRGVGETALACGYRNLASFSRQFKTTHGVTPSEFAERSRSGEPHPV